jgi:hypothetical protein
LGIVESIGDWRLVIADWLAPIDNHQSPTTHESTIMTMTDLPFRLVPSGRRDHANSH